MAAGGQAHWSGTRQGHFVILREDILNMPVERIDKVVIEKTMIGGRIVHQVR